MFDHELLGRVFGFAVIDLLGTLAGSALITAGYAYWKKKPFDWLLFLGGFFGLWGVGILLHLTICKDAGKSPIVAFIRSLPTQAAE